MRHVYSSLSEYRCLMCLYDLYIDFLKLQIINIYMYIVLCILINSNIYPPEPNGVQNHMKHIESLSGTVQHKVFPHLSQPLFQLEIHLLWNLTQNLFQPRNI